MTYTLSQPQEGTFSSRNITRLFGLKKISPFHRLSADFGIDLGTSNTLVFNPHQGIVLQESSVIAMDTLKQVPVAIGSAAAQMLGRNSANVRVCRPVRNGVVTDLELTQLMLQYFILKAQRGTRVFRPRLVIGCSCGATDIEREALTEAALEAGARDVILIDEPIAAAMGVGLPIEKPIGNLIVDIGGGSTEMAIVCSSSTVLSQAVSVAGDTFNQAIVDYLRRNHQTQIGELTAEGLKIQYGSAAVDAKRDVDQFEVVGIHMGSGLPHRLTLQRGELREALSLSLQKIAKSLLNLLDRTSPELITDISERGIMLTGGGALLSGMDIFIKEQTGLPVHVADTPLNSVVLGTGAYLQGYFNLNFKEGTIAA